MMVEDSVDLPVIVIVLPEKSLRNTNSAYSCLDHIAL
jgi:hypothetical protein